MSAKKVTSDPADRRVKTILEEIHPEFIELGAKTITHEDVGRLIDRSDDVLAHFSRGGPLRRFAREIGPMISLVRDYWSGDYHQVPYWTVAVISFTLLYVLKPVDIIPDSLPVIGQLDDAVVFQHGLDMVTRELEVYGDWRDRDHAGA